jgi:hypothetical protein
MMQLPIELGAAHTERPGCSGNIAIGARKCPLQHSAFRGGKDRFPRCAETSARSKNDPGVFKPSASADLRLTVRSNLVGWMIGRSVGSSPLESDRHRPQLDARYERCPPHSRSGRRFWQPQETHTSHHRARLRPRHRTYPPAARAAWQLPRPAPLRPRHPRPCIDSATGAHVIQSRSPTCAQPIHAYPEPRALRSRRHACARTRR